MNLYVSSLDFHILEEDLRKLFEPFGEVSPEKGRSRGFGFIEMPSEDNVNKVVEEPNNMQLNDRTISVTVARERENHGFKSRW